MAAYTSKQIAALVPSFGGLGGAPGLHRSSFYSKLSPIPFNYTQSGTGNVSDTIDLAYVAPTCVLHGGYMIWSAGAANSAIVIGLTDPNYLRPASSNAPLNLNAKFLATTAVTTAGNCQILTTAGSKQVGYDPTGDSISIDAVAATDAASVSQVIVAAGEGIVPAPAPADGNLPVTIQMLVLTAGLQANQTFAGYLLVSSGN